mmetsp:Transcript_44756/g.52457  ORF Transcript_44756/g.52457 Transcript_44756/m.52457 type:complete len:150 (+) Transcript_44756:208-657(+)
MNLSEQEASRLNRPLVTIKKTDMENPLLKNPEKERDLIAVETPVMITNDPFIPPSSELPARRGATDITDYIFPEKISQFAKNLGRHPVLLTCPFCLFHGQTKVHHRHGPISAGYYVVLLLTGLIVVPPLACLPCCCKKVCDTCNEMRMS